MCLSWPPVRTPYYRPTTRHARNNHRAVEQHLDQPLTISLNFRWAPSTDPRSRRAGDDAADHRVAASQRGVRNCQGGFIADLLRPLNNDTPSQLSSLYDDIAPAAASLKATRTVVPCT